MKNQDFFSTYVWYGSGSRISWINTDWTSRWGVYQVLIFTKLSKRAPQKTQWFNCKLSLQIIIYGKIIFLIIISHKIEKNGKKLFHSFGLRKYKISKFSGPLLIGQNDSLDVRLLDEIYLQFIKGRNDLAQTFGC